jgi:YidC/Oxa1 family membrane protein insertase
MRLSLLRVLLVGCLCTSGVIASGDEPDQPASLQSAPYRVTTSQLQLDFSHQGALISAIACFPNCGHPDSKRANYGDDGVLVPEFSMGAARQSGWDAESGFDETHQLLTFFSANDAYIQWRIPHEGYLLEISTRQMASLNIRSGEPFRPEPAAGFGNWLEQIRLVVIDDSGVSQHGLEEGLETGDRKANWAGYRSRYWTLLTTVIPDDDMASFVSPGHQDASLSLGSDSDESSARSVYLGPIEPRVLRDTDPGLSGLLYSGLWFWLRWICFGLFYLLDGIRQVIPDWGLAIMSLSVVVHVLMRPLSMIADRLQAQVNATESRLSPEISKIKKESSGEEQSNRILALYRSENVHPLYSLKSLAGVAVVIPVFIGAFDMLAENIHLQGAGFLWITDLSRPDHLFQLPFELPFFGASFNLLPFLMTGLSIGASLLHRPLSLHIDLRHRQARNMLLLAAAFFVLFYTFPAGMVLYWTTNNLVSVIKTLWHHLKDRTGTRTP